ncbi:MAG: TonB-dependent receptor [Alphaproteobacteria bacterium]|nr:TonB-dependent receptor [Alphaproteobacteria bacterium]
MKKPSLIAAMTVATLTAGSGTVNAQSMDYGSLEALFGQPVTTSAIGIPQRASEVPVTMEIITADEIRRSPATDLAGVLKNRAGVEVSQWSVGAADVAVRGYNQGGNPRLLVLVNGRQVYLDHFGLVSWNSIPVQLAEIRQIEIVKGPNTALFGFNAVSGVVNIVTYSPMLDDVDKASVTVGTQNHQEGSFVGTFKLGSKAGFRISAGGTDADAFDTPTPLVEQATLIDYERRSLSLDSLFQIADNTQFGFEATTNSTDQTDFLPTMRLGAADYETQSLRGRLLSDTSYGRIEADLYTNILDLSIVGLNIDNQVTVFKLQDVFKIGTSHNMRISGEYRHNALESSGNNGGEVSYDVFSLGGMWNWLINEKFSLTNALRVDNYRLDRQGPKLPAIPFSNSEYDANLMTLSVNSGLVFKPDQTNTFRLSYGRGVEAPSLIDAGFQIISGPATLAGNPYIDPTIVNNYELAWERPLAPINGNLRTAVFYQKSTDVKAIAVRPVITPVPFGFAVVADNIGSSKMIGGEIQLDGKVGTHWDWKLNYTLEDVDDNLNNPFLAIAKEFENSTPKHTVNAQLGYAIDKWEFDLFGKYVSSSDRIRSPVIAPVNFLQPVDSYVTASARVGYKLTDEFTLALQGQDIQESELRQTQAPKTERRVLLTLSSDF